MMAGCLREVNNSEAAGGQLDHPTSALMLTTCRKECEGPVGDDERRDTRQRILEAGLEALSAGGYSSISMRRLAESCGVTKPTLYYHFGSKKGLFDAMLKQVMSELESLLLRELDSSISVREALERLL